MVAGWVAVLLVGLVWLASLTAVIVVPVIVAAIVAAVGSPLVGWLSHHRVPRALGAALLMLAIVAIGTRMLLVVVLGITGQASDIGEHLSDAEDNVAGWLQDLGLSPDKADQASRTPARGSATAPRRCSTASSRASGSCPRWPSFSR